MALPARLQELVATPGRRIAMSMLGFGVGALLVSVIVSWLAISVAESVLPSPTAGGPKAASSASGASRPPAGLSSASRAAGGPRPFSKTPGSKAGPGRGNDSPSDSGN